MIAHEVRSFSCQSFNTLNERTVLIQQAFRLEWLTVAWMVIEAMIAIGSGVIAGSLPCRSRDGRKQAQSESDRRREIRSKTGGFQVMAKK